jgi:hypothetical protein
VSSYGFFEARRRGWLLTGSFSACLEILSQALVLPASTARIAMHCGIAESGNMTIEMLVNDLHDEMS